jgi:hypothetical protein
VLGRAQGTLQALDVIGTKGLRQQQQQVVHWQPPPIDSVKCNLDAVICLTNNNVGVKAYIRNEKNAILLPP